MEPLLRALNPDEAPCFPLDLRLKVAPNQVVSDLGDETVVFNLDNSCYYSLNPVAACVWALLQESRAIGEVVDRLTQEYEVETERCRADLDDLLRELLGKGLIRVVPQGAG